MVQETISKACRTLCLVLSGVAFLYYIFTVSCWSNDLRITYQRSDEEEITVYECDRFCNCNYDYDKDYCYLLTCMCNQNCIYSYYPLGRSHRPNDTNVFICPNPERYQNGRPYHHPDDYIDSVSNSLFHNFEWNYYESDSFTGECWFEFVTVVIHNDSDKRENVGLNL